MLKEHVSGKEFVDMAKQILGGDKKYEDAILQIKADGDYVEVTRKPMPAVADHLQGTNPVTMAAGDDVYRHHGEHCYLTTHMRGLIAEISGDNTNG